MNKKDYYEIFPKFAKTSIKEIDGEINLYGHSVLVTRIGEDWDIWFCNAKQFLTGDRSAILGTKKLLNLIRTLPEDIEIHFANGEGWFKTSNVDWLNNWLWDNRKGLGIAQRRPGRADAFKHRSVSCDSERLH